MKVIKKVAIAGAGTMGAGIAQVTAQAGFDTLLYDINNDTLENAQKSITQSMKLLVQKGKITEEQAQATLSRICYTHTTNDLICDLVIEAIVEKVEVKQAFFKNVAAINSKDTILASNTSSIPITQIAAGVSHPERVVGIHFFNPAPIMKLVEIISGVATDKAIANYCFEWISALGKICVHAADAPGFIVNRVARHYYVEGLKLAEEQVADFKSIDVLMESAGFKMGPFKLMDLIGVDTNFSVTTSIYQLFHQDGKFRPNRIQQQKVLAGHHGRKTGKGFYEY
jgi:3-hydroxybutyryl-CoA dehydrogenase